MNRNSKVAEFEKIISESCAFRNELKKTIQHSENICHSSLELTEGIQTLFEESALLLEEKILIKEEALAAFRIAQEGREIDKFSPVYYAFKEDMKVLNEMHKKLNSIPIPEENLPFLALREKFNQLSFLSNDKE